MQPILVGDGHYSTTGNVRTDTFKLNGVATAPSPGMRLVFTVLVSTSNTTLGTVDGTGWAVATDGITAADAANTGARAVHFTKVAGANEPSSVTYTAPSGGVIGARVSAFPEGATVTGVATQVLGGTDVAFGSLTAERDSYAIAGVSANGNLTDIGFTNGFTNATAWGRMPIGVKAVTGTFPQSVSTTMTNTTWRDQAGALLLVSAAEVAPPSGGIFLTRGGVRRSASWRVPSPNTPQLTRVLVDTDAGGDPDDLQSLVRAMHYSDEYKLEGVVSTVRNSNVAGDPDAIRDTIRRCDLPNLRAQGYTNLITESEALALVKVGARSRGGPSGTRSTEGSDYIIQKAHEGSAANPLYLLGWGPPTNIAQAFYDDPTIAPKVRVYTIGDFNTDPGDLDSHTWLTTFAHANNLWWVENGVLPRGSRSTFFGIWKGGNQTGNYSPVNYLNNVISGKGTTRGGMFTEKLGDWFPPGNSPSGSEAVGGLKEGDSPSLLYVLSPRIAGIGDLDDPTAPSWGGQFEVINPAYPKHWGDLKVSAAAAQATINQHRTSILDDWTTRWNRYGVEAPEDVPPPPTGGTETQMRSTTSVFIGNQADVMPELNAWTAEYLGYDVKVVHHTLSKDSPSVFNGNVNAMFGNSPGTLYGSTERTALIFIMGFKTDFPTGTTDRYSKSARFASFAKWRSGAYNSVIDNLCNKLLAAGHDDARIGVAHESDIPNMVDSYVDLTIAEIDREWVPTWRYIVNRIKSKMPNAVIEWRNNGGVMNAYKYPSGSDQYQYEVILTRIADLVDNVSCSAYYSTDSNVNGNWDGVTRSVKARLDFTWSMAVKHGKNMSIYEWGMSSSRTETMLDHPSFITNMYNWIKAHLTGTSKAGQPIEMDYHVYFQKHYGSNLEKYPKAKAEYIRLFSDGTQTG